MSTSAERMKKFRENNPEQARNIWRKYAGTLKGRTTLLLDYARNRATRYNIPFSLDRNFVETKLIHGKCELTGIEFDFTVSLAYKSNPFGASLDRKIPNLGYTKDNTRMICYGLNMALSDWGENVYSIIAAKYIMVKHTGVTG